MELQQLTDIHLVNLYQRGDNKAFDVLLSRYGTRVFNYIYFFIRDADQTKDIFQDTFYKAIISIRQGRYSESGKFLSWINRIAHNIIIDSFGREKKQNTLSVQDVEHNITNDCKLSEKSIEDILLNEQTLKDVVHLIGYLSEQQQEVIQMRFFEGLSFNEIAEITNISVNTALGRARYALMNMCRLARENDLHLQLK